MKEHKQLFIKEIFIRFIYISLIFTSLTLIPSGCKTKEGCGMTDKVHVKVDKKGRKKGKTQSGLFPKKVTKRMKHGK